MTTARAKTHDRPDGVADETVAAVGKFSEALEWVDRGRLYDFHQMMGRADFLFGDAAERRCDARICEQLMDGRRHVFEAELKEQRRTRGLHGHESRPDEIGL
jgi:hypothetical protein